MIFATLVLIVSAALFGFYLQTAWQKALRREFAQPYFQAVANAYRLQFPGLRQALDRPDWGRAGASLRTSLKVDFAVLTCLMRETAGGERPSLAERLLRLSFRVSLLLLAARQTCGLNPRRACQRMTAVLAYFANRVGERWSAAAPAAATPSEYLSSL